jgi:hypothetical protein
VCVAEVPNSGAPIQVELLGRDGAGDPLVPGRERCLNLPLMKALAEPAGFPHT